MPELPEATKIILAGAASGIVSTAAIHPMDTIRTRLQSTRHFTGVFDCAVKTVKNEGLRALYKGVGTPLVFQGAYKTVMFSSYTFAQRILKGSKNEKLGALSIAACGGFAGGVNSFVVTPVELVRNRQMVNYGKTPGAFAIVKQVVKQRGVAGLFKGQALTLLRDVPGVSAWYFTNEMMLRAQQRPGGSAKDLNTWNILFAGATAGFAFWSVALPLDTIKTKLQTDMSGLYQGPFDCGLKTVRNQGVLELFRGWPVAFGRGIPAAALVFWTFGSAKGYLDSLSFSSDDLLQGQPERH